MTLKDIIENGGELIFGASGPESAIVVGDYPYGRKVRTTIRYWLESKPNYGDRFMAQTMNPKTGNWNKPKASTYAPVGVIYREGETGYIRWYGLRTWPDDEQLGDWVAHVGADDLNDIQRLELAKLIGRSRVFKHVKWSVRSGSLTPEERKERDEEQERIKQTIGRAVAVESYRAHKALTGEEA